MIFLKSEADRLKNHPVHYVSENDKLSSPTAMIPYCSFANSMSIPGVKIDQFQVPVCSCFRPKNVKDQLCYEADLNVFKKHIDDLRLLSFSLVIDFNEDRVRADEYNDNDDKPDTVEENLGVIDKLEKDFIILGTKGKKITYISLIKNK